jgi:hypothetical protein
LLSFLKETRGRTVWAERDLVKSLNITSAAAKQALAILEMQGYVNPEGKHEWLTTTQGEVVSGSKFPKYSRKSVEQSLGGRTRAPRSVPETITREDTAVKSSSLCRMDERQDASQADRFQASSQNQLSGLKTS